MKTEIMNTTKLKDLHPEWVLGFIDGEGCFHVAIMKNSTMKLGFQVQLHFSITQHSKDKELMNQFLDFFGCGYVAKVNPNKVDFRIRDINDIENHLFPFLEKYSLRTIKYKDAADFKRVFQMMKKGQHLTPEGLTEIKFIKSGMNRGRKLSNK